MSSKTGKPPMRSAAWRISCWATVAFAFGTLAVFIFLHRFVASDIQRRSDAWLSGEVETLGDVAERTPKGALYDRVVGEVAELATREAPNNQPYSDSSNQTVFFLQVGQDWSQQLWVGPGKGQPVLSALRMIQVPEDRPVDLRVPGVSIPYRVASIRIDSGSRIFLGLSERDELRVLNNLRLRFILWWMLLVLLGFGIVFYTTWRMLSHVRKISEAASRIGHSDLHARVPTSRRNDEVSHLALTLNVMLDQIENTMHQLHTITDSLAHDLRSPLTAIRGKLEMSLQAPSDETHDEQVVAAIEELDRLTEFLNKSLDVAEAKADALRLTRCEVDLGDLLHTMIDLYEPSMADKGLKATLHCAGSVKLRADAALLHRMIANLLDNELHHLPPGCAIHIDVRADENAASLLVEDNGPGFDPNVLEHVFERRVKGRNSSGHGLGLAFVDAVARAHGGTVLVANRQEGGARIRIALPNGSHTQVPQPAFSAYEAD